MILYTNQQIMNKYVILDKRQFALSNFKNFILQIFPERKKYNNIKIYYRFHIVNSSYDPEDSGLIFEYVKYPKPHENYLLSGEVYPFDPISLVCRFLGQGIRI